MNRCLSSIDSNSHLVSLVNLQNPHSSLFREPVPVAFSHQVQVGPAEIFTVLSGNRSERFEAKSCEYPLKLDLMIKEL